MWSVLFPHSSLVVFAHYWCDHSALSGEFYCVKKNIRFKLYEFYNGFWWCMGGMIVIIFWIFQKSFSYHIGNCFKFERNQIFHHFSQFKQFSSPNRDWRWKLFCSRKNDILNLVTKEANCWWKKSQKFQFFDARFRVLYSWKRSNLEF